MTRLSPPISTVSRQGVRSLGVVSFLNALPLRATLIDRRDIRLRPAVPSALLEMLLAGECDSALLPVVDFWKHRERLRLISDACIASDGETLTVRVFSKAPPDRLDALYVDGDSHTSIILAQLIWRELYQRSPALIPWKSRDDGGLPDGCESILLIGDKVIRQAPRGFGFQVDLGAAWKHLTGLPFVFAAWYGDARANHAGLAEELESARDAGVADAERLAREAAAALGWPAAIAVEYLTRIMKYTITPPMREGMERFFELIDRHGLIA